MKKEGQFQFFEMYSGPKQQRKPSYFGPRRNHLMYLVVIILILGVVLTSLNVYELHRMKLDHDIHHKELERMPEVEAKTSDLINGVKSKAATVCILARSKPADKYEGRSSFLKHVFNVFEKFGFTVGERTSDWHVLWSHDYPFPFKHHMKKLRPFQRVNHFPGSGYITNKVTLAQENFDFIPKAFEIPARKEEFLEYSEQHKDMKWVQKSNKHRGIEVKGREDLDFSKAGTFIQQYVSNPYLIDGYKFDIGIYTIITALDPLRVYFVNGDALFRFCPQKYHPFDPNILDKYVVGDDYLPLWKLPSLKGTFVDNGFTFKDSFNEYLRSKKKDPQPIWDKMLSAIGQVILAKETTIFKLVQNYPSKRSFFEMMRFDFVLDDNLNVFLMEANMSPNLSSDHFKENARLYEHVIYNLLNVVGVSHFVSHSNYTGFDYEDPTLVSSEDIHVFPDFCGSKLCKSSCIDLVCRLCKRCLSDELEKDLKVAYLEHTRRGSTRRIFPPSIIHADALEWIPGAILPPNLKLKNRLIYLWFIGKCRLDSTWCQ